MSVLRKRLVRLVGSVVVTGLCIAYIVWQIDVGRICPAVYAVK